MSRLKTVKLLDGVSATGAGDWVQLQGKHQSFQIEGITTATVKIQASNDQSNAVDLSSSTADEGLDHEGYFAYYRANVTAYTDGTITVTACTLEDK